MTKQINTVFDAPTLSDTTEDIETKAYDTLQKLNPWSQEANALAEQVNQDAQTSSNAANAAVESAADAANSAIIAQTFAGLEKYKGTWVSGNYAQGESVKHNGNFWISDIDGNTSEPGVSGWSLVPKIEFEPSVKPTLKFDFARNEAIIYDGAENSFVKKSVTQAVTDGDLTVSNGAANVYDARGRLAPVSANKPRLTFNPETGESEGLLVEEARTNLVLKNSDLSLWGGIANTLGTTQISGYTLTEVEDDNASSNMSKAQALTIDSGEEYALSFVVSKGASNLFRISWQGNGLAVSLGVNIDFTSNTFLPIGNLEVIKVIDFSNGLFKVECRIPASEVIGGTTTLYVWPASYQPDGSGVGSAFVGSVKIEKGSYPTSDINTAASSVTRVADSVYRDLSGDEVNSNEGCLYAEYRYSSDIQLRAVNTAIRLSVDGDSSNAIGLWNWDGNNGINLYFEQDGTRLVTTSDSIAEETEFNKVCVSWKNEIIIFTVNGRSKVFTVSQSVNMQFNKLEFVGDEAVYHKDFELRSKFLSESECIALTGGA